MKTNMGAVDRLIRFILALAMGLLIYYDVVGGIVSYVLLAVIGVFALTSLVGFCPLYSILGWNTFSHKKKRGDIWTSTSKNPTRRLGYLHNISWHFLQNTSIIPGVTCGNTHQPNVSPYNFPPKYYISIDHRIIVNINSLKWVLHSQIQLYL